MCFVSLRVLFISGLEFHFICEERALLHEINYLIYFAGITIKGVNPNDVDEIEKIGE